LFVPLKKYWFYWVILAAIFWVASLFLFPTPPSLLPSTLFYYGRDIPIKPAGQFQRVIVEPDNITQGEIALLKSRGVIVYAYLSIGEVGSYRSWLNQIDKGWVLGKNEDWNSRVMDLTQVAWRQFIIDRLAAECWARGFQGFFLDTMDSYQNFTHTANEKRAQQQGIIILVNALSEKFSGVSLLFNRGFEVVDEVAHLTDGIVAESLFSGWDAKSARYQDVSNEDYQWLLKKLTSIRDTHQLPVTVLDYLSIEEKGRAEEVAHKIRSLGFVPWVSTVELNQVWIGADD
jgi:uncharacterized protein (TIGR01370 family)